ncbi:MAG: hypothetical protein JW800_05450, partial [Candidatus Omnitrophica bacterium]|nr:hypothetical protein [Candidatus Omnitrophota bacterium]
GSKKNELSVEEYAVPQYSDSNRIFQQTLILPRIIVSEPQTVWITTYSDGQKVQEYPIEFLYK